MTQPVLQKPHNKAVYPAKYREGPANSPIASMTPHEFGRYGENIACTYLREHGYVILDRNWSGRYGELDIVAVSPYENGRKTHTTIIEVKTRRCMLFGTPVEAVTPQKLMRLKRAASLWLEAHPQRIHRPVSIDVIAISFEDSLVPSITHLREI